MPDDMLVKVLTEHGPWVMLVFYLLYRDWQKDQATMEALRGNTSILIELATLVRDRPARS